MVGESGAKETRPFDVLVWFRNSFAAGVALVLPFAVTFWVIWTIVSFIDRRVEPFLPPDLQPYASAIPGAGVVIGVVALTLLGALAANLLGRFVVTTGERLVARVPLVRTIYGGSKQIFGQFGAADRTSFKEAVLIQFPGPGLWSIGFVTSDAPDEAASLLGEEIVAVFVPMAPVPTGGFLLYARRADLRPTNLKPEDALKRVISLGIINQDQTPGDRN